MNSACKNKNNTISYLPKYCKLYQWPRSVRGGELQKKHMYGPLYRTTSPVQCTTSLLQCNTNPLQCNTATGHMGRGGGL